MFGEAWNETAKAIKLINPITEWECWIPKAAIIGLRIHRHLFSEEKYYAQRVRLKAWFRENLKREMNNPHNEERFNAQATYKALNKTKKEYILEKVKYEKERGYVPPTGLPL